MPKLYTGEPDMTCPYRGGRLCAKVCPTCVMQIELLGKNPNTGEDMARWDCALRVQHVLTVEGNLYTMGVRSAVDDMKNEVVEQNHQALGGAVLLAQSALRSLPSAVEQPKLLGGER